MGPSFDPTTVALIGVVSFFAGSFWTLVALIIHHQFVKRP